MKTFHPRFSEPARNRSNQDQQAGAGFSQVDLLTVVVVLALLALLLTPALARTRVTDQAFQCRNNLRQLLHAWRMYADDNSGNLCNAFDWVGGLEGYGSGNFGNTNDLLNGELGPYVKGTAFYKCPADQSSLVRTISMSQSFTYSSEGRLEDFPNTYRHYVKTADMTLPSPVNLWVMIDESPGSVNDAAFAVEMQPYGGKWQDGPTTLHNGGCGFAFADGHSEIHKWTDSRTLALNTTSFLFGISQPNNPDIKWVQDRTTAPK
jgi:prepilin-type processing-associated H-X9-DG protein